MKQKKIIKILLLSAGALVFSWGFFFLDDFGLASISSRLKPLPNEKTLLGINEIPNNIVIKDYDYKIEALEKRIVELEGKIAELNKESVKTEVIGKIDINTAPSADLQRIIHIGPTRAQNIINLRPFFSLDDLLRVPGIGEKILEDIKIQGLAYISPVIITEIQKEKEEKKEEEKKEERENDICIDKIDINSASKEDLQKLTGVGSVTADNIIEYRRLNRFQSVDDLTNVTRIGSVTLSRIKEQGCAFVVSTDKKEEPVVVQSSDSKLCSSNSIDINTADKEMLEKLTGVGSVTADNIIEYRRLNRFQSVDDLTNVTRIGSVTLNKIKEQGCAFVVSTDKKEEPVVVQSSDSKLCSSNSIDINTASYDKLKEIVHIGSNFANQIIRLRNESLFVNLDDLSRVSGISIDGSRLRNIKIQGCAYVKKLVNEYELESDQYRDVPSY